MAERQCPTCGKWFHSLGYARHRTMHYEERMKKVDAKKKKEVDHA